jgi:hypothetical protein|tara:strand:- start:606 stop:968 length:363 start_codon:yes stop_codon:yes gene_type:complete
MNVIDFRSINEASLQRVLGNVTKNILRSMYGVDFKFDVDLTNLSALMKEEENIKKFSIRGEPAQVKSYIKATARMKFYLDAMMEFGKKHPTAIKRKEELDQAVSEFQQETGVTWPFKHEG